MRSSFSHSLSPAHWQDVGERQGQSRQGQDADTRRTRGARRCARWQRRRPRGILCYYIIVVSSLYVVVYISILVPVYPSIYRYIHTYIYYEPSTGCRPPQHAATCPAKQRTLTRRLRRRRQAAVVHKLMGVEMFTRTSRRELSGDVLGGAAGLRGGLSSREAALLDRSPASAAAPSFDLPSRCLLAACLGHVCAHLCVCVCRLPQRPSSTLPRSGRPLLCALPPPNLPFSDCPLPLPASLPRPSPSRFLRALSP